jgi:hypothetical protein
MVDHIRARTSTSYFGGPRANSGVVFIGAAAHSGSTLLGFMLGSHPSIFHAGEANKTQYFADQSVPLKKRVCKVCGTDCVVWENLRVEPGQDLYEVLSRRSGRPIVFDSSKMVEWIKRQVAVLHGMTSLHLIVLSRDGRAVVNSRLRKQPEISAYKHATAWVDQMRDVEELALHWPGPVYRLRYEELALRPVPTLRALADFIGIAFDPVMADPWDSEQHPLGGNNGPLHLLLRKRVIGSGTGMLTPDGEVCDWYPAHAYYSTHPQGIVLDVRWKHEMSAEAFAVFDAVAGETNHAYAWEEPAVPAPSGGACPGDLSVALNCP